MMEHGEGWQREWLKAKGIGDWAEYYSELDSQLWRQHA